MASQAPNPNAHTQVGLSEARVQQAKIKKQVGVPGRTHFVDEFDPHAADNVDDGTGGAGPEAEGTA